MILEGIVTSLSATGELNIAPMGPIVDSSMATFRFRPFKSSTTYQNLKQRPNGVFHVTDDVLLIAKSVIDGFDEPPATFPAERIEGRVLEATCRWYEFRIVEVDDTEDRTNMLAEVVHSGRRRDFFGFNRAKHAVIEAAILASRVHLLPPNEILDEFDRLKVIVGKTAGSQETRAFSLLFEYVAECSENR